MSLVAVDLAAKYSAACWLSDQRQVIAQWDSWQKDETCFIDIITSPWQSRSEPGPHVMVVEDLPHGLKFDHIVRAVCRIQGRIVERMTQLGHGHQVLFVPPSEWRKHYPVLRKRGSGPAAVVPVAAEHNYNPPDLTLRWRKEKGERALSRKVATDYCAAYLIGWWALDCWYRYGTVDMPGTSRYGHPAAEKELASG